VQEDDFVGVAAPTTAEAAAAIAALAKEATWEEGSHASSKDLFESLVKNVAGGMPKNPFDAENGKAAKTLHQAYNVAYVQHAPLEPRAALAEWEGDKLTVWVTTQNPFGARNELAQKLGVAPEKVRVVVPDFGGGFGGRHTPDAHIEAARLAKAAGKPVLVRWTREEEFTWAYFRPAAVIDVEAGVDAKGLLPHGISSASTPAGRALAVPTALGRLRPRPSTRPRRCGRGLIGAWAPRPTTLPARASWMNSPRRPAWTRSTSAWRTSRTAD
jgi:isoquinoline 1-oxidoreductase subunit beta